MFLPIGYIEAFALGLVQGAFRWDRVRIGVQQAPAQLTIRVFLEEALPYRAVIVGAYKGGTAPGIGLQRAAAELHRVVRQIPAVAQRLAQLAATGQVAA